MIPATIQATLIGLALIGIAITARQASRLYIFVVAASAITAFVSAALSSNSGAVNWPQTVLASSFVMAVGFTLDSIVASLLAVSQSETVAWRKVDQQRTLHSAQIAEQNEALDVARELHNRVANTFAAAAYQQSGSDQALRERCRMDLDHFADLQTVPTESPARDSWSTLVANASAQASRVGIDLVASDNESELSIPDFVQVNATVVEAVTNAAKHSGSQQVALKARNSQSGLVISVIDDGSGWPADRPMGIGTRSSWDQQAGAGLVVAYSNRLSGGCATDIYVPRTEPTLAPTAALPLISESTVPVARSIAFWLLGFCGVVAVLLWPTFPVWWWLTIAVLGTCSPMTLINLAATKTTHRGLTALASAATVAVVVALPLLAPPVEQLTLTALLSGCVAASVSVLLGAWLSPPRFILLDFAGFVAGLGMLIAASRSSHESIVLAATGTALLLACATIGIRALRRWIASREASWLEALEVTSRETAEIEITKGRVKARQRIVGAVDDQTRDLLRGLSTGDVDPARDSHVHDIRAQEHKLRIVIALTTNNGLLGQVLMDVMQTCNSDGIPLHITGLNDNLRPPPTIVEALATDLPKAAAETPDSISVACYSVSDQSGIFVQIDGDVELATTQTSVVGRRINRSAESTLVEYVWDTTEIARDKLSS